MPPAFQVIERLITEGDEDVQNLGVIGYLEGIQNSALHSELISPEDFLPFLGTESIRWWRGLNALWAGEVPPPVRPIDEQDAERNGPPDPR